MQRVRTADIADLVRFGVLTALAAGGAAYLLDPQSGRRRRALVRDQALHASRAARAFIGKATRDARERTTGLVAVARRRDNEAVVDDRIVQERVRAALGRLTTHPRSIHVACNDGAVRLSGDVLRAELHSVIRGVAHVRGVKVIVNDMLVHAEPGRIPALQGAGRRATGRPEFLQENWSPAPRLFAAAIGVGLLGGTAGRGDAIGYALATVGAGLLTRAILNRPLTRVVGARSSDADGVLVQKSVEVYAEVSEVYDSWRDLENLPRFMSHVREVRKVGDTRYHWVVDGPAGVAVEWDSEITADAPEELIAWRTVDGAAVQSSGVVQFEPTSYGGTRVHIRMIYRPPTNAVGHTIAKLFGRDPKRQIDEDMLRFKTFIESGRLPDVPRTQVEAPVLRPG